MAVPTSPARLTSTVLAASDAAAAADGAAFTEAVTALAALDPDQVRTVLGWVLRGALEELHPDGLDADDLREVVGRVARGALPWFAGTDPQVLVVALTGAFGEHPEQDGEVRLPHATVVAHSVLLAQDLARAGRRPLARHLEAALAEVRRAETVEMP